MNSRRAGVIAILFICLLAALWALSAAFPNDDALFAQDTIEVVHRVEGDRHSYTGNISVPAACDSLGVSASIDPGLAQARVELMTQRLPGITCPPEKTTLPFSVSLQSPVEPRDFSLTLDGTAVATRLIEE